MFEVNSLNNVTSMSIIAKRWQKKQWPKSVLAIRLQAMGDLVITLPYLQALRNSLPPETTLDLLTRKEVDPIPKSLKLFNHIYSIRGGRNFKKQCIYAFLLLPKIIMKRYDVVLDLQNNLISRTTKKVVRPEAWSQFDKVSPLSAGERTRLTIEAIGLGKITATYKYQFKSDLNAEEILKANGWNGVSDLVIINPAGAFPSRNWSLENYAKFTISWLKRYPFTQFVILGTNTIMTKAAYLEINIKELINLTGKTSAAQAFAIIQQAKLVLSEDSGLMHMAWISGVSTLAIFGSTRSDWSRPLGEHSFFLDSSDLPCGNCMLINCKYGTTQCLTRFTPEFVFEKAVELMNLNCRNQTI